MSEQRQTSATHPLRIVEIPVGSGMIGITFAPGKQIAGVTAHHHRDLATDLDAIAAWNAAAVVTLMEAFELDAMNIAALGAQVRLRHMEWHHWPIVDVSTPAPGFDSAWPARSVLLRRLLACGGRILIHCRGGLGRTGMISARLLVEGGMPAPQAIATVRNVRPGAIETPAQERWVAAGAPAPLPAPATTHAARQDRAIGALVGLAVGDAVGLTLEFQPKPHHARLHDMCGGGPFRLKHGEWTDDTAMALALADSLLRDPALDAADLMARFADWQHNGTYSCTGHCFDIGITVSNALNRFARTGNPLAGSTDDQASGNGALMRLSPVAVRYWNNAEELTRVAELQTRTTHGSPATLRASRAFATLLAEAIAGKDLPDTLATSTEMERPWRSLHRDEIRGTGYVVASLQAAIWAVSRTTSFRSAVLLAANLGEDADTTAAIAGQLAGAIYGLSGIPKDWLEPLAWRDRIEATARDLFTTTEPKHWMTGPWTLRQRLEDLASHRPALAGDPTTLAHYAPSEPVGGVHAVGMWVYDEYVDRFIQAAYDYGWVRVIDWPNWSDTPRAKELLNEPTPMNTATAEELEWLLTTCLRSERFCDGAISDALESGLITRILARAQVLLNELDD